MTDTQPIRLTDAARFELGGVTVMPAARTVAGAHASLVIEPRVMQVLVTLHRRYGEVVGREALLDACWDGRTVGEDAVNRAILKLRRALDEIGGGLTVETVAKVGYRLCVDQFGGSPQQGPSDVRRRRFRRRWLAGAGAGAGAMLAAAIFLSGSHEGPPSSRVVLVKPLQVAAADVPAQRLAQDFTSDLSRAVLGSDGRLEFANGAGSAVQTVAFTVAGSVASIGKDLHAVVTVTRRDDPAILWSHDYTAPVDDANGLRQQVGTNVAAVLVCALGTEGVPEQVDVRTTALYLETCTLHAGDHRREADLLRLILARAPRFAGAWADLAISLALVSVGDGDAPSMRHEALGAAMHALSLDPHLGRAYYARALLLPGLANWAARERILQAGLAAQPDCPPLYSARAHDLAEIGRQRDSIANNRRAVALDPLFPGKTAALAHALADAGRLDEANDVIRHMQESWPDNHYTWFARFETAARFGKAREAEAMLDDTSGRFLRADEIAFWRAFLRARETPTGENVQRAISVLLDERRKGTATDAQLVEDFALLGRPERALDLALHMPVQAASSFWFRSFLQPVRADPRFIAIAERQGLYSIWRSTGLWPDFCSASSLRYECRQALPDTMPTSSGGIS